MQHIPSEYLAIDRRLRAHLPFYDLNYRASTERVCDFDDVVLPFDAERARYEASRCIHCPDPAPCVVACPTSNDIPSAMWLIEHGDFLAAAKLYRQSSSLPEICSRVCPHEQLCQGSCVRNATHEPVLTGMLEAFALDIERAEVGNTLTAGESTGKRVAVVGAGPAGLGCAEQLIRIGHQVTMFDTHPAPGGLLLYGIPNFKLPKDVVFKRWQDFADAGVTFVPNTRIGQDKTIDNLFDEGFDAIFLGIGANTDAKMEIPGEDLPGVFPATDFLVRANVDPQYLPAKEQSSLEIGKRIVVIGGGDTAADCLRTAVRIGAEEVTCLYRRTEAEMPGGAKDRTLARQEGASYRFLTQPIRFIAGDDGRLKAVECLQMQLGEPDKSGRRRPVAIEGSNFIVEADTAVLALGYWPDPLIGETTPELQTHKYGLIIADKRSGQTSRPGVFAGGDGVTGPDLVVTAMVAGRNAAAAIDEYLRD